MTAIRRAESQEASKQEQREALVKALTEHNGNVKQTAAALGMARSHINELLDAYDLRGLVNDLRQAAGWSGRGRPRVAPRSGS